MAHFVVAVKEKKPSKTASGILLPESAQEKSEAAKVNLTTARLNNLKECHLHDDAECPEGKYSNSAEIIEKMKAGAGSWF